MADIEKISVGGTSYDVRDALAAHALSDIAVAGDNITFINTYQNNVTLIGSPAVNGAVLSNLSASNYATGNYSFTNSGPFAWKLVAKFTTGSSVSNIQRVLNIKNLCSVHLDTNCLTFEVWYAGISPSYYRSINASSNTTYLMSIEFDGTNTYTFKYSTNDGQSWTTATTLTGTFSTTYDPSTATICIGNEPDGSYYFKGSIDLAYIYLEINSTEVWRGATQTGIPTINATVPSVDQTYNSASANAQSGVAINGAGFLKNTAVGSNSLTILGGVATSNNDINIGLSSRASGTGSTSLGYGAVAGANNSTAIGSSSKANGQYSIGIGNHSNTNGATGMYAVAIGSNSSATQNNCVAVGNYAGATGYTSVAVGMCQATANYAIQLGVGTNGDANTFSVGLGVQASQNYRLLNSDGTIPGERMALQGTEAPTTATAGSVGQFYVDTTNQVGYMCVSAADSTYVWKQITV